MICSDILPFLERKSLQSWAMATRYYFHLSNGRTVLRDEVGVWAADLEAVHRMSAEIIAEFRGNPADRLRCGRDWALVVTDQTEEFALVMPLVP